MMFLGDNYDEVVIGGNYKNTFAVFIFGNAINSPLYTFRYFSQVSFSVLSNGLNNMIGAHGESSTPG